MSLNQWHLVVQGADEQRRKLPRRLYYIVGTKHHQTSAPVVLFARSSCSTLQTPSAMIISIAINKGMKYVVYPARIVYEVSFLDKLQET